ncbi:5-methylcytosine restriction system specificity protein McrC [Pseudonocardia sp. GCM10023141]|uniref:5-methylcytosine restriction system specificity protein McrC n=1 Tax=Pseudonocardia sp. GCM10023141 TaxID=3252653 RepID=UPI00360C3C23
MSRISVSEQASVKTHEYGSLSLARSQLTEHDLELLSSVPDNLVQCAPSARGWELRTGPVCGVLHLDGVRVVVHPKLMPDGTTVASWIGYAGAAPTDVASTRRWSVDATGLPDIVVSALVKECATIARDGLHRDYRRNEAVDTVLRGRLDIRRQMSRRYGQVDVLHMHRFDREVEVWENLVCRAALDAAARIAGTRELRQQARVVAAHFPPCASAVPTIRRWLVTARDHRMNVRYQSAHLWAGLLLNGGGVNDMLVDGSWNAGTLLINMNVLWERVVQRPAGPALDSRPGFGPHRRDRAGPRDETLHPRCDAGRTRRVGHGADTGRCQVQGLRIQTLDRNDAHQLLTYASAFHRPGANPEALIVHPVVGRDEVRSVDVRAVGRTLGRITLIGIDSAGAAQQAIAALKGAGPSDSRTR